jgi:hypothetical protein
MTDQVAAVLAATTPGPWSSVEDGEYVAVTMADPEDYIAVGAPNEQNRADARFIALARNTYPELLAVARAAARYWSVRGTSGAHEGPHDIELRGHEPSPDRSDDCLQCAGDRYGAEAGLEAALSELEAKIREVMP